MKVIDKYLTALAQLKVKNSVINNDIVVLEAGHKRYSIRKSRAVLVKAIERAAQEAGAKYSSLHSNLSKQKNRMKTIKMIISS